MKLTPKQNDFAKEVISGMEKKSKDEVDIDILNTPEGKVVVGAKPSDQNIFERPEINPIHKIIKVTYYGKVIPSRQLSNKRSKARIPTTERSNSVSREEGWIHRKGFRESSKENHRHKQTDNRKKDY